MHTCPECGSACYCNGDIDDVDVGDAEAEDNCTCCAEGTVESDEDDDLDWNPYESEERCPPRE